VPGDDYERGVAAGEISARLAGHDAHFALINGSLIDVAAQMKAVNLQLQRMADAMQADRERAVATAAALREADEARRLAAERHWTPLSRMAVLAGALAALAGIAAFLITTFRLPDRRPAVAVPVETKVKASTAAAAASGLALWALGRYVFKGDVPDVVASWVYVIIPAALAFGAGYLARHTSRPVAAPAAPAAQPPA
jgi:hypothetical protein